jgi:protein-L-isoaspartate(D-aspartate) O-methyltransferase
MVMDFEEQRARMVESQLASRGIRDERVLDAMRRVARHRFVPEPLRAASYQDGPLSIGAGQTISQPYIVAFMTEAAEVSPEDRVLEIGTGSGYQTAVLAELAGDVYSIEVVPSLYERTTGLLETMGYTNLHLQLGDGHAGWPEAAPFDAIVVTAAPEVVPRALVEQLATGGRMVIPVGRGDQQLRVLRKLPGGLRETSRMAVRFVPMVDAGGVERRS